jgi:hypothetical protein
MATTSRPDDDVTLHADIDAATAVRDVVGFRLARLALVGHLPNDPQVRRLIAATGGVVDAARGLAACSDRLRSRSLPGRAGLFDQLRNGLDISALRSSAEDDWGSLVRKSGPL